ncbi:MAG: ABC transporter ATP-binding protein [Actinomycetota bacterium]|nr:ABC transporter ATP-binding protein [Actinomycetota bacterium]
MSEPLLRVENLRVEIPTSRAVVVPANDVSFDVFPGEAVGLVGESGCGKSTTLRALLGLLRPPARIAAGRIVFDGRDLAALGEAELRKVRGRSISIVFQEPMSSLNPLMRVGAQIAEALRVGLGLEGTEARKKAIDLMRRVGIPDAPQRARAYPHELSGGMRQRVMIAIALSCRPKLILCDEPTTALDVTIQDQILGILADLQAEEGLSLLYVTHDLPVVAQLCSRVVVMYAGQILESGPVVDVFADPRHPYTLGLLRSAPAFDDVREDLRPIPGTPPDLASVPSGCPFHPRCAFVQRDCVTGEFPPLPLSADRSTACIHSSVCVEATRRDPVLQDA